MSEVTAMKREDASKVIKFKPRVVKPPQDKKNRTGIEYEETLRVPQWLRVTVYSVFGFIIGFFLFAPLRRLSLVHWLFP